MESAKRGRPWVPYGSKTLHKISAAYRAYIKLSEPPAAAPSFELDENNYPHIAMGEVFCLWEHSPKQRCGQKYSSIWALQKHLEDVHGCLKENRPERFYRDKGLFEETRRYYTSCMRNHNYEGKALDQAPVTKPLPTSNMNRLQQKYRRKHQRESLEKNPEAPAESMNSDRRQTLRSRGKPESASNTIKDSITPLESEDEDGPANVTTENKNSTISGVRSQQAQTKKVKRITESSRLQSSRPTALKADHNRVMSPTPIILDSDSEAEVLPIKAEENGTTAVKTFREKAKVDSDVEDLELEVEEAEAQLRLIAAKRKLMARKKRRQARGTTVYLSLSQTELFIGTTSHGMRSYDNGVENSKKSRTKFTYNAYLKLDIVPANVPHFDKHENGYPMVEFGEVFCRMPDYSQRHCSARFSQRDVLLKHLENFHGASKADRPPMTFSKDVAARAQQHYITMMKDQDYDGKGSERTAWRRPQKRRKTKASRASIQSTSSSAMTPALESDDGSSGWPRDSSRISNRLTPASAAQNSSTLNEQHNNAARMRGDRISSLSRSDHEQMEIKTDETQVLQRDQASSRITAPTPISIDSDDDMEPSHVKVEPDRAESPRIPHENEFADEDLELEIEEDEIQLRIVKNKRKLAARRRMRQERK
ncbi:hypothetical protein HII31_10790 [Pseudocercospora fuligena]|uniref:Uncharacterized protein n=1 Tax=Pseudocercospora fuligena TaxID=685502 RepID=A0A8H6R9P2_9PEZI|nr:hypothetical protein HII31_10790 [Pseudocercospora fuligena]